MSVNCPLCGSEVPEERGPIKLADDGLPVAVSLHRGLPVPFAERIFRVSDIRLDGVKQSGVVAFDREKGAIWRYVEVDGRPLIREGEFVIERVEGKVTVA